MWKRILKEFFMQEECIKNKRLSDYIYLIANL